jgi:toxin HigB-1
MRWRPARFARRFRGPERGRAPRTKLGVLRSTRRTDPRGQALDSSSRPLGGHSEATTGRPVLTAGAGSWPTVQWARFGPEIRVSSLRDGRSPARSPGLQVGRCHLYTSFTLRVKESDEQKMRVEFDDDDLRQLFTNAKFRLPSVGPDLANAYRRRVNIIVAAKDERDLRAMRSLHFEKLGGDRDGQYSIRLHDQWRLILRLERDEAERWIVIIELIDYH